MSSNIDGEGWTNYFKNLLNNKVNNLPFNDYIKESLNFIENIPAVDGSMSHVNSNIESDEFYENNINIGIIFKFMPANVVISSILNLSAPVTL